MVIRSRGTSLRAELGPKSFALVLAFGDVDWTLGLVAMGKRRRIKLGNGRKE